MALNADVLVGVSRDEKEPWHDRLLAPEAADYSELA